MGNIPTVDDKEGDCQRHFARMEYPILSHFPGQKADFLAK